MAKTDNPIGKGTRQIVINLHQEEAQRAPEASVFNHGEIVVQGTDEDAKLYVKRKTGGVATFIESATTHNAIQAAVEVVEGYVRAQGYALSGNLDTLSATVVSDYATSANTEQAIATAKAGVIGQSGDDKTADTIYGAKAYANSIVAETSITGATGDNYVYANKDGLNIVVSANTGAVATDTGKLAVTDDVKAYVDGAVSGLSGNLMTYADEAEADAVAAASSYTKTVSGNIETTINNFSAATENAIAAEASARTAADKALSDRIDAIASGSVLSVTKGTDGDYVSVTIGGDAQNPTISVDDTIQAVASADASDNTKKGLAEASDVKTYVDNAKDAAISSAASYTDTKINTLSSATHTEIETAKGWASGYTDQEINTLSGNLTTMIEGVKSGSDVTIIDSATTEGYLKSYTFMQGSKKIGVIDIPKDLVVTSGEIVVNPEGQPAGTYLKLTIANQTEPVYINVADLADVYTAGSGITISNTNEVAAKVVEANGLSVDGDGIKMAVASSAQAGAMSAADKAKLDGIANGAQVNVLEGVKVNGADLTIDGEKKVNIIMSAATGDNNGQVKINGENIDVKGLGSAAYEDTTAFDAAGAADAVLGTAADTSANTTVYGVKDYAKQYADSIVASSLTGATGDTLVNATTNGKVVEVSATQKLQDAVASAHNHANKDVLDGITAGQVTAWDAAEQNAKDYADGIVSGLSGNIITYVNNASGNLETALGSYATSADTVSAIATAKSEVIGTTGDTSSDTTIEGVKKYVDEKVAGESIASVDVNNKDAMAISATTVDRAVTLDFTNMIIDCGTY